LDLSDVHAGAEIRFFEYTVARGQLSDEIGFDIPVLRIVFPQQVFFDSGSSHIRDGSTDVLRRVAQSLAQEERDLAVFVAGHTDSVGSAQLNNELSMARAGAVAQSIQSELGNASVWQVGFGESLPLMPNTSSRNRGINRRVEFVVAATQEAVAVWLANQHDIICSEFNGDAASSCMRGVEATSTFKAVQLKNSSPHDGRVDTDTHEDAASPKTLTIDAESRTVDGSKRDDRRLTSSSDDYACWEDPCWRIQLQAELEGETYLLGEGGLSMNDDDQGVQMQLDLGADGEEGRIVVKPDGQAYVGLGDKQNRRWIDFTDTEFIWTVAPKPTALHKLSESLTAQRRSVVDGHSYERYVGYGPSFEFEFGSVAYVQEGWVDSDGIPRFWIYTQELRLSDLRLKLVLIGRPIDEFAFPQEEPITDPIPFAAAIRRLADNAPAQTQAPAQTSDATNSSPTQSASRLHERNALAQLSDFLVPRAYAQSTSSQIDWGKPYHISVVEPSVGDPGYDPYDHVNYPTRCRWEQDGSSGILSCEELYRRKPPDPSCWTFVPGTGKPPPWCPEPPRREFEDNWCNRPAASPLGRPGRSCREAFWEDIVMPSGKLVWDDIIGTLGKGIGAIVPSCEAVAGLTFTGFMQWIAFHSEMTTGAGQATRILLTGVSRYMAVATAGWCIGTYFAGKYYKTNVYGDPHIGTFDGSRFGFQVGGEFVYVASPPIEVQQRFRGGHPGLNTYTVASAIRIGDHVIEVYRDDQDQNRESLRVVLDGRRRTLGYEGMRFEDGSFVARRRVRGSVSGSLTTSRRANSLVAVAPDGSYAVVETFGISQSVSVSLTDRAIQNVTGGLAGRPDGNPSNDFWLRNGSTLPISEANKVEGLYGKFGSEWRVQPKERLFSQGRAEDFLGVEYTTLPDKITRLSDFDQPDLDRARQTCVQAGIPEGPLMEDCIYDVWT
jgi:hypothetical protein